jgi:D-glycero-D-manno-heptose 1,7-bisphosphate phosphatase
VSQAAILVGGKGTRLCEAVASIPKPLMEVAGRPFLDRIIAHLSRFGIQRVLLLAGYLGQVVAEAYDGRELFGVSLNVVVEPSARGTAGALAHCLDLLDDVFLLSNGDSLFDCDLTDFCATDTVAGCIGAMLVRHCREVSRSGVVGVDASGRVQRFWERPLGPPGASGVINSGVYLFSKARLGPFLPRFEGSLEADVLPRVAATGQLRAIERTGYFIDIGVSESLAEARGSLTRALTRSAAFLDRDGVLNVDCGYAHKPSDLAWTHSAIQAVRHLNDSGYYVFVVTNQGGVAKGFFTTTDVQSFHRAMQLALLRRGAHVDAFYYCPHHPDGQSPEYAIPCCCRKPLPGLLEMACKDWPVARDGSFLVGDKRIDLEAAASFGIPGYSFGGGDLHALVSEATKKNCG